MASTSSSRSSSLSSHRLRRRSSPNDALWMGQEYRYALPETSISEWLKCAICLNPFVDPVQASTCEHIFCSRCINTHMQSCRQGEAGSSNGDVHCPTCRSVLSVKAVKPAATLIRNMVDSLLVKCPHERRGCSHTCERSFVDRHASRDCGWAWIGEYEEGEGGGQGRRSSGRGRCECGKRILRKDWQSHLNNGECSVERVQCPYADGGCRLAFKTSEMDAHQNACSARPVHCMHCNAHLRSRELQLHEDSCAEAVVTCPFARFGCLWQGKRCELSEEHLPQCQLAPLEAYLVKQEQEVHGLRQENTRLAGRVLAMEESQRHLSGLLKSCISSLGPTFFPNPPALSGDNVGQVRGGDWQDEEEEERRRFGELVVPIPSPHHQPGRAPISPPLTLRGRSGSSVALPFAEPTTHMDLHDLDLASTSAPASSADFAWQWPESNSAPPSAHPSSPQASPSNVNSHLTVSDSLHQVDEKLTAMFDQLAQMDRRVEDNHVVGLNANFEASRAHEELNSVRHGLHALRISLLLQQQRNMPGNNYMPGQQPPLPDNRAADNPGAANAAASANGIPLFPPGPGPSMMGLRRFWNGYEQTKL